MQGLVSLTTRCSRVNSTYTVFAHSAPKNTSSPQDEGDQSPCRRLWVRLHMGSGHGGTSWTCRYPRQHEGDAPRLTRIVTFALSVACSAIGLAYRVGRG